MRVQLKRSPGRLIKPDFRKVFVYPLAILSLVGAAVFAQESTEQPVDDDEAVEEIEEITVTARKPGDRRRVDEEYQDPALAELLKEYYELQQEQEEFEWRASAATDDTSRISWGYDPRDEYRMRNEMDLNRLPSERTQPASVFRVGFGN